MKHAAWAAMLPLALLAVACQPSPDPAEPADPAEAVDSAMAPASAWQCRNDVEISCDAERCETAETFTPMDIRVSGNGAMSVCAYSGCWEGTGTVSDTEHFLILMGHDLSFSTAPDTAVGQAAILVAIDKADHVGVLKAGTFAQPVHCEQLDGSP